MRKLTLLVATLGLLIAGPTFADLTPEERAHGIRNFSILCADTANRTSGLVSCNTSHLANVAIFEANTAVMNLQAQQNLVLVLSAWLGLNTKHRVFITMKNPVNRADVMSAEFAPNARGVAQEIRKWRGTWRDDPQRPQAAAPEHKVTCRQEGEVVPCKSIDWDKGTTVYYGDKQGRQVKTPPKKKWVPVSTKAGAVYILE